MVTLVRSLEALCSQWLRCPAIQKGGSRGQALQEDAEREELGAHGVAMLVSHGSGTQAWWTLSEWAVGGRMEIAP